MSTATTEPTTTQPQQEAAHPGRGIKPAIGLRVDFIYGGYGPHYGIIRCVLPELAIVFPDQDDSIDGHDVDPAAFVGVPWRDVRFIPDLDNGLERAAPAA